MAFTRSCLLLTACLVVIATLGAAARTQPAAAQPPAAPGGNNTDASLQAEQRPLGRVWGVHSVTSGVGPRGLNPGWDKVGKDQRDWRIEFSFVTANLVTPFGRSPTDGGEGFDEIIVYRPWGVEDHADKAMVFDALDRARARAEQLPPGAPGATALRRMIDVQGFVDGARAAQDRYGKPFWYYLGQCNDPKLEKADGARLHDYVQRAAEPIFIVGGNIFIDDSGGKGSNSTAWHIAQLLRRQGVRGIGYEPAAHTIQSTNNAPLKGGATQFTPWAHDPEMVGLITGPLWKNRIEWRDPRGLNKQDGERNGRAWMVPLDQTAGEVIIWGYAPDQQTTEWLVNRLAEGWSVAVGIDELKKLNTTPAGLRSAAQAKRQRQTADSPPKP